MIPLTTIYFSSRGHSLRLIELARPYWHNLRGFCWDRRSLRSKFIISVLTLGALGKVVLVSEVQLLGWNPLWAPFVFTLPSMLLGFLIQRATWEHQAYRLGTECGDKLARCWGKVFTTQFLLGNAAYTLIVYYDRWHWSYLLVNCAIGGFCAAYQFNKNRRKVFVEPKPNLNSPTTA